MSASGKLDFSSGSPDRPLYASGHRGSYGAASLDGPGSFQENMENPLLSNLPNMARNSSSVTKGDVLNFFQCLRFDPKSMVVEHKLNRLAEFKCLASAAVGIQLEDSLPPSSKRKQRSSLSLEDLRQLKSGARESGTKARERVMIFKDCLSVVNKCFPTPPSRKRSRLDALSKDRSKRLLSIDRSTSGMGTGKMGSQNFSSPSGIELDCHKPEERTKKAVPTKKAIPSKRTRTSMVDARMDLRKNTPARPSGTTDKDKDVRRLSNSSAVQGEDQTSPIAVGCWEHSKMKKKRTGKKLDPTGSVTTKPVQDYRERNQGMQQLLSNEARSRSTIANGVVGVGKAESIPQTTTGIRLSMPRADSDSSSLLHERRDHSSGQEKERVNLKAINKINFRENFSSGSPTSGSKLNANVRGPRSGSVGSVSKLSQVVQRSPSSNEGELSNCTSKYPGSLGSNYCKHTPTQSSPPSVASWVQGPRRISRTARRTNLLPIVPGKDEIPVTDAAPDVIVNERHIPANSPLQVKIKGENFSPAALSESEESVATEIKSRNKNKKGGEVDERSAQNVQKMSTLLLPVNKNKTVSRDGRADGIRRQGRTGRGSTSSRSLVPLTIDKIGSVRTTKQIRSSRLLDKTERAGRPSMRKLPERKACTRQKHTTINMAANMAADIFVSSDDGHEELLAAAKSVTNTAQAISRSFWNKMEPLFRFICDTDISYLKEKVNLGSAVDISVPALLDTDSSTFLPFGHGFGGEIDVRNIELSPEHSAPGVETPNEISLYQRLIAALIPEEGNQEIFDYQKDLKYDLYGSRLDVEKDAKSNALVVSQDHTVQDDYVSDTGYGHLQNGLIENQLMSGTSCSEYQYHDMSLNERLLMEVHSIGICPDLVSDLAQSGDEIIRNICGLIEKYQEQVAKNKGLHDKLLNSVSEAKELQEKEFERHALDKLVGMAYEKYMSCWGPNAHRMKSGSGKVAKQAALAFVKRTLKRYQEFEATGKSCFGESLYKETFLSGTSRLMDEIPLTCIIGNESDKLHPMKSGCSVDVRPSAPLGTLQSTSSNNQDSSEMLVSANLASELNTDKEDSWSNRDKRRELSVDDVDGTISASGGRSGLGGSLSCSAKGKRSERDREGKGRAALSRRGNTKIGRPPSASVKGDRKSKAKPKQKTPHLSASVNGPLGKMCDQPKVMLPSALKSTETKRTEIGKDKNDYNLDMLEEPIDLSGLQLPDMDDLGVSNDLDGHGGDIGSWLNLEDDGLQDPRLHGWPWGSNG